MPSNTQEQPLRQAPIGRQFRKLARWRRVSQPPITSGEYLGRRYSRPVRIGVVLQDLLAEMRRNAGRQLAEGSLDGQDSDRRSKSCGR